MVEGISFSGGQVILGLLAGLILLPAQALEAFGDAFRMLKGRG